MPTLVMEKFKLDLLVEVFDEDTGFIHIFLAHNRQMRLSNA